ncbi:PREDICTED: protein tweety homolog 2-like, partial [Colobus angolensis palliatus]|uniref:protein tweety homolog 2-like n=1 Tax=Colobus angolensis palliatus TaxID=336983 RepID=UPI0005F58A16
HSVPHLGLRLQPVNSTFNPGDESYQESLLFLGLVATVCLGLNLIFLVAYLVCACCCQQDDAVQTKQRHSCCITWTAVVAGLVCCAAVGVGFYGNSETNDGVYQLMYSLEDANHTFSGIDALVRLPGSWPAPGSLEEEPSPQQKIPCPAQEGPRAMTFTGLEKLPKSLMGKCQVLEVPIPQDESRQGGELGTSPHAGAFHPTA